MAAFLGRLQSRGIILNGSLVHPRIGIGTVTGRVVYRDPALQNLPKFDRLTRLGPVVDGRGIVRADYREFEPRILHAILRRRGLIGWDAGDDLYRTLGGDQVDRSEVKVTVNRLINSGGRLSGAVGDRLAEFARALATHRGDLARQAKATGRVETLTGRSILVDADVQNHAGRCVNGVVQGTAADIFNAAVLCVAYALEMEGLPAAVAFLLFDELWVECDPDVEPQVVELVRREMEAAPVVVGVTVPVRIEVAVDPYDVAERAAIMEFDGKLSRSEAERRACVGGA
jgi:hypothetical protein